jgi:hypothetical protein
MYVHAGPFVICRAASLESNGRFSPYRMQSRDNAAALDALDAAVKIAF